MDKRNEFVKILKKSSRIKATIEFIVTWIWLMSLGKSKTKLFPNGGRMVMYHRKKVENNLPYKDHFDPPNGRVTEPVWRRGVLVLKMTPVFSGSNHILRVKQI